MATPIAAGLLDRNVRGLVMPLMPKQGTLERVFLDALIAADTRGSGVTFMDFEGTGITEENIDQIAQNLRNCMYESEDDARLKKDA